MIFLASLVSLQEGWVISTRMMRQRDILGFWLLWNRIWDWYLCDIQMSDDAERYVLVKLKNECGYQFTNKLESMFTDIRTSRDMMQNYKRFAEESGWSSSDLDLSVQVHAPFCHTPFVLQRLLILSSCRQTLWSDSAIANFWRRELQDLILSLQKVFSHHHCLLKVMTGYKETKGSIFWIEASHRVYIFKPPNISLQNRNCFQLFATKGLVEPFKISCWAFGEETSRPHWTLPSPLDREF